MLAIYTRLSKFDEESNSIENQLREGRHFAKENKLDFEIYDEGQGISGKSDIDDRPQLDKLLKDIATGKIKAVWMRNQNRLERNSMTFHVFADLAKKNRLKVVFGNKEMDWNDPSNFLQSSILTAINSYQAELQSYQTRKSLLDNVREGKTTGKTPYGYTSDKNNYLVICPKQSKIVKQIFADYSKRIGTVIIANYLNEKEVDTPQRNSTKWNPNVVMGILKNPLYIGQRRHQDKIYDAPSFIDKKTFKKVQKIANERGVLTKNRVNRDYLLSGLVKCGNCGKKFHGRTYEYKNRPGKKFQYYRCGSKHHLHESCGNKPIVQRHLEEFVWHMVVLHGDLGERVEKSLTETSNKDNLEKNIEKSVKKLDTLDNEWKRIRRSHTKGLYTDEELLGDKNRIERERERINKDIDFDMEELAKITNAKGNLDYDPSIVAKNEKTRVFKQLIEKITVLFKDNYYHITVDYNLPIDADAYQMEKDYTAAWQGDNLRGWVGSDLKPTTQKRADRRIRKYLAKEPYSLKEKLEKDKGKDFIN